jgi:hypothetical protein
MTVTKAVVEKPSAATVRSPFDWGRRPAAPAAVRVRVTAWSLAAGSLLILWSLAYLARQQLPLGVAVASPLGDFALEGVALALAWLGAMITACPLPLMVREQGRAAGPVGHHRCCRAVQGERALAAHGGGSRPSNGVRPR